MGLGQGTVGHLGGKPYSQLPLQLVASLLLFGIDLAIPKSLVALTEVLVDPASVNYYTTQEDGDLSS